MNKFFGWEAKVFLPIWSNFFHGVNRCANKQLHNKGKISITEDRRRLPSNIGVKVFLFQVSLAAFLLFSLQRRNNNCSSNRKRRPNLNTFELWETITHADTRAIRHTNVRLVHRKQKTDFDMWILRVRRIERLIDYRSNINYKQEIMN